MALTLAFEDLCNCFHNRYMHRMQPAAIFKGPFLGVINVGLSRRFRLAETTLHMHMQIHTEFWRTTKQYYQI